VTPAHPWRPLALLAMLAGLAPWPAAGDLVVLRNGQELRGRVRSQGDKVSIALDVGGTVVVARGDVKRMEVDPTGRRAASQAATVSAELLARLKAREAIHTLIDDLAAQEPRRRKQAELGLAKTGRSALPMVREALGDPERRGAALRVLAAVGDPAALPDILGVLRNPKDQALHVQAAEALAEIGGAAVVPTLTELLVSSQDTAVRAACLKRLAARRAPFAVPFVAEALRTAELRATARAALGRWVDPVALPYVLPLLDEGPRDGRERAGRWVAALATPAHAVMLARLAEAAKENKPLAKALLAGLRRLHGDFPVVGDIELLAVPHKQVKNAAFESLKKQFADKVPARNEDRARDPRFWRAEREAATAARLLVVAVGATPSAWARELAGELERSLKGAKLTVAWERKALSVAGQQGSRCDGRRVLAALEARGLPDHRTVRVIGVTTAEVAMPGYDRALAPTRRGGAVLLSLAPLGGPRDQVLRRARRLALHALARSMGMGPSGNAQCPSSAVYEPSDLDAKSPAYGAEARTLFGSLWDAAREAAALRYRQAGQRLSRLARDRKSKELRAEAAYAFERGLELTSAIAEWTAYQQLEKEPALAALVGKRIALLNRSAKWLARTLPSGDGGPRKRPRRPPRRGG